METVSLSVCMCVSVCVCECVCVSMGLWGCKCISLVRGTAENDGARDQMFTHKVVIDSRMRVDSF